MCGFLYIGIYILYCTYCDGESIIISKQSLVLLLFVQTG